MVAGNPSPFLLIVRSKIIQMEEVRNLSKKNLMSLITKNFEPLSENALLLYP